MSAINVMNKSKSLKNKFLNKRIAFRQLHLAKLALNR